MADDRIDLETLRKMIAWKVQVTDSDFTAVIDVAIAAAWGQIAKAAEWPFLRNTDPPSVSLVANVPRYEISRDNVGRPLYMSSTTNSRQIVYRNRQMYDRLRKDVDLSNTSTPQIFTTVGLKNGHPYIEVFPTPNASSTVTFEYYESGALGNITLCPANGLKPLLHGIMAHLAPPKEVNTKLGYTRWDAICYKENELFDIALAEFIRQEGLEAEPYGEPQFDAQTEASIMEIYDNA